MGVHGLWRLIEPSGKPVPLESLENKVLAVDVSIWLHQAVKGFQDSKGASVPNAHLLGIYHRVCKLLYFKIKPIFVFDGGVPVLKKETIAKRTQSKLRAISASDQIQKQLLTTLLKHSAVSKVLTEQIEASIGPIPKDRPTKHDDMYILPSGSDLLDSTISSSEDESYSEYTTSDSSPTKNWDLHSIDMDSVHFKSLPVDVRHEILTDLKETRKQSSWGRLHELPKVSDDFSTYQMKRLLKRQAVQSALEEAEKEMGGKSLSLAELESLLNDQGVLTGDLGKRIASDEKTKYLLVKDVKKAIEEARKKELKSENIEADEVTITNVDQEYKEDLNKAIALSLKNVDKPIEKDKENETRIEVTKSKADQEYEDELNKAIALSLECAASEPSQSSDDEPTPLPQIPNTKMSLAQSYMMEYSGLTPNEISKLINKNAPRSAEVKEKLANISSSDSEFEEVKQNTVEIMSSSDSDEALDIVIDPNGSFDQEDDLFADVFESTEQLNKNADEEERSQVVDIKDIVKNKDDIEEKLVDSKEIKVGGTSAVKREDISTKAMDSVELDVDNKVEVSMNESLKIDELTEPIEEENDKNEVLKVDAKKSPDLKVTVPKVPKVPQITEKELQEMKEQLQKDKMELLNEKSSKDRMAGNITDQMYQETQELLELFGVPYVIAPMEAEAQCAFFDAIELTDGTITEDSDIWLFGGKTVYKNFFNPSKYVMEFKVENIRHNFKLSREQMILLALLVGSDYTIGLKGIGPVTAMEILAAFPHGKNITLSHAELLSGLKEFRSWFTKGKSPGPGRSGLKTKLKNITFSENFPNMQVVLAYLDPTVETSKEPFSWGKPNFGALIQYARDKFGWTKLKCEEVLNPVVKKIEDGHQKTIKDYFKTKFVVHSDEAEKKMSKRVKSAVTNMGRNPSEIVAEELAEDLKKLPKKRTRRKNKSEGAENNEKAINQTEEKVDIKNRKRKVKEANSPKELVENVSSVLKKPEEVSELEKSATENSVDVSEKINAIRRRRKVKELKAAVDVKKPKVVKETVKLVANIPSELQGDEEVSRLVQIVEESELKDEEIHMAMQEKLERLRTKPAEIEVSKPSTSSYFVPRQPAQASSSRRPPSRPTRVPRKETIPQKERDKTTLLRNKLKAIEVFRKGKKGPGYVPKKERNKRMPKDDAGLSESSGED
ncbi:DNA excision repair protein ERCC-5 [Anthonomus grandis grandis]|uniref:DNA excision repair protein ERCC-5 n=1 Tax=Anthonomus grandis grandis TaxID=2921223 RepID=UPI00216625B8|nr:DNA excision repair protein ERCC-5 [Anthonomus grandis grandis]